MGVALALTGCESRGSLGERPVARCVPEGSCGEAMFELGLVASRGDATRGAPLYQATCAVCHGPAGRGVQDARRVDMTSPAWHARMRDGEIARVTRAGRPPIMPAFPLSDQQVRDLLAFIRTLKVDAAPAATPGY